MRSIIIAGGPYKEDYAKVAIDILEEYYYDGTNAKSKDNGEEILKKDLAMIEEIFGSLEK